MPGRLGGSSGAGAWRSITDERMAHVAASRHWRRAPHICQRSCLRFSFFGCLFPFFGGRGGGEGREHKVQGQAPCRGAGVVEAREFPVAKVGGLLVPIGQ